MKGDFTRDTFEPIRHFSRVLMQQGRVQLDADWNKQVAILLHYIQTLTADLIGPHGGPGDGFTISAVKAPNVKNDFIIGAGHYYVNGILCELEETAVPISLQTNDTKKVRVSTWVVAHREFQELQYVEVLEAAQGDEPPQQYQITAADPAQRLLTLDRDVSIVNNDAALQLRRLTTYLTQPDYPVSDDMKLQPNQQYLVYLDVWERHISSVEDAGDISLREVALGGPDTATRAKVVWQVKVLAARDGAALSSAAVNTLPSISTTKLRARAKQDQPQTNPCVLQPEASYRGAENQLYRVEIHTGNVGQDGNRNDDATPTFKWSRENGSVIFPIVAPVTTADGKTTVTLAHFGYDDKLGLHERDWVEIVDNNYTLQNRAEPLLQVQAIDYDQMTVTLDGVPPSKVGSDLSQHPLLRRWDHTVGETSEGVWLSLEDGVQIQFSPDSDSIYRTGDYWSVAARTATRDVEWHTESAMPPHGVKHHYAPLAVISVDANGIVTVTPQVPPCRQTFDPLGHVPV